MTILSLAPLRRMSPTTPVDAGDAAARQALAAGAAPVVMAVAEPDAAPACGWFDSSWELQQGLAVSELPEAELPVAALWFAQLMPALLPAQPSAWLQ